MAVRPAGFGIAGGSAINLADIIDHTFATRTARNNFYTTDPDAAANLASLVQGETFILVLDDGAGQSIVEVWVGGTAPPTYVPGDWADITTAIPTATTIKTLYESNANTNALVDVKLTVLNALSLVNNELVSNFPVRASEFRTNTGSLMLGNARVSFAGSGLELNDPVNNRQCGIVQKVIGVDRAIEYVDQAAVLTDVNTGNTMSGPGNFTGTYTVSTVVGREGTRAIEFIVIPEAAGEAFLTLKKDDVNGPELFSRTSYTFAAGDVNAETSVLLENDNAFRVEDGTVVYINYEGPALRGSLVSGSYFPFLRVRANNWTVENIARQSDITFTGLTVQDEGSSLTTDATSLNFTGTGVTASGTGAVKTINIPGAGSAISGITVQDEGSGLTTEATTLNFVGTGVTASGTGVIKTVTVPGGIAGITVQDEGTGLTTEAITLNFTGAGVTATGTGLVKTIDIPGTALPQATHTNYIDVTTDSNVSSVDIGTAVTSDDLNPTVNLETFTGNRYVQILQSMAHTAFTSIIISGINQLGGFTVNENARTISGQAYRQYVTTNLITDALSGAQVIMGGAT